MKARTCHGVLLALGCVTVADASAARGEVPVVRDGAPQCRIVVPAKPTRAETFAAEDVQAYVWKITGAELIIASTDMPGDGAAIIIGHHAAAKAVIAELDRRRPDNHDRIAVVAAENRLYLTGHCQSGIVWAAWDWLESLGVRWLFPGPLGEYVPKMTSVVVPAGAKYDAPRMVFRGPNYSANAQWGKKLGLPAGAWADERGLPASTLFGFRMRLNNNASFDMADSIPSVGSGHSYDKFLHPNRYYKEHPEWFNLVGGKRLQRRPWQVCFTNAAGARQFAANLCRTIAATRRRYGIPAERMRLFVAPNDWKAQCECPTCQDLVDRDGATSSLVLHYANLVATEVRKTHPGARIVYYVYDNYGRIPDRVSPGPGVYPEIVFWTLGTGTAANHAHPMFSKANARYREVFGWFAEHSEGASVHTYYGHYNWFTPWPKLTQIATDLPALAKHRNVYGMYSETHRHWGTQGLTMWLHPKLMWDPTQDVDALVTDYCEKAFGPAALFVRQHLATLQERMDRLGYVNGSVVEIPALLTPEVVEQSSRLMDEAAKRLDGMDAGTRWRTSLVIQAWRASAKFGEAVRRFVHGSNRADRERILARCDEVRSFAETDLGRWAFEHRIAKSAIAGVSSRLRLDLGALPAGKCQWADSFMYGGAVKFFAKIKGLRKGLWGYSLPVNGQGTIELPLQASPGHRIVAASVHWQVLRHTGAKRVLVSAVGKDGKEIVLAQDLDEAASVLSVPAESLGTDTLLLRIAMTNEHHAPQIAIVGVSINVEVNLVAKRLPGQ